jgi:hypothetical protein
MSLALQLLANCPLNTLYLSVQREREFAQKMIDEKVRDGILGEAGFTCDALPWDVQTEVITDMLSYATDETT